MPRLLPRRSISTQFHFPRRGSEKRHGISLPDGEVWFSLRVPRGWVAAGQAVNARRLLMGLSIKQLAKNAGCDPRTVADLIHARRYTFTDNTLAGIERALAWQAGSIVNIANEGQEPQDEEGLADIIKAWPTLSPELRAALVRIISN